MVHPGHPHQAQVWYCDCDIFELKVAHFQFIKIQN